MEKQNERWYENPTLQQAHYIYSTGWAWEIYAGRVVGIYRERKEE